eukprot:4261042-Pyramimonas_sp.AAC.1
MDIRGRAAAIRVKSFHGDITCLGLYFPPRSKGPREQLRLSRTIAKVHECASNVITDLPSRTFPLVESDVNDGLGIATGRHCPMIVVESTAIGAHGLSIEHQAGAAMRELAEIFDLAALDTFYPRGPSYYGAPTMARRAGASGPSAPRGGSGSSSPLASSTCAQASEREPRMSGPSRPSAPRGGRGA